MYGFTLRQTRYHRWDTLEGTRVTSVQDRSYFNPAPLSDNSPRRYPFSISIRWTLMKQTSSSPIVTTMVFVRSFPGIYLLKVYQGDLMSAAMTEDVEALIGLSLRSPVPLSSASIFEILILINKYIGHIETRTGLGQLIQFSPTVSLVPSFHLLYCHHRNYLLALRTTEDDEFLSASSN
jgi:hypothetical protein